MRVCLRVYLSLVLGQVSSSGCWGGLLLSEEVIRETFGWLGFSALPWSFEGVLGEFSLRMRKSDEKSGNRRRDGVVKGVLKYVKERELGRARYLDRGRLCKSLTPCHVPISTIIDEERKILSCVILGFSADSNYLISYQRCFGLTPFGEGGSDEDCSFSFTLQFWLFEGPQNRLRCTYETELFDGEKFETSQLQADRFLKRRDLTCVLGCRCARRARK